LQGTASADVEGWHAVVPDQGIVLVCPLYIGIFAKRVLNGK
jgi:hypothetical protein